VSVGEHEVRVVIDAHGRDWVCRELPRAEPGALARVQCTWGARLRVELVLESTWREMHAADLAVLVEGAIRRGGQL
jgi:hypothetical protein